MENFSKNIFERTGADKLLRYTALVAVLSAMPSSETPLEIKGLETNPVLAEMVKTGEVQGDCEEYFQKEFFELPLRSDKEVAFAAVYSENDTCKIMPLGTGSGGGVFIDASLLKEIKEKKDIKKIIFYHTHPAISHEDGSMYDTAEKEIESGRTPSPRIARPSEEDFMTMTSKEVRKFEAGGSDARETTEERVVTPLGIWRYGIQKGQDVHQKSEESAKLGSLFSFVGLHDQNEGIDATKKELDSVKRGYADVGVAANTLDLVGEQQYSPEALDEYHHGDAKLLSKELKAKITAANDFSQAMNRLGYSVSFTPHSKYQSMLY